MMQCVRLEPCTEQLHCRHYLATGCIHAAAFNAAITCFPHSPMQLKATTCILIQVMRQVQICSQCVCCCTDCTIRYAEALLPTNPVCATGHADSTCWRGCAPHGMDGCQQLYTSLHMLLDLQRSYTFLLRVWAGSILPSKSQAGLLVAYGSTL